MVYNNAGNNYNNYVAIDYPQPAQYYELMRSSAAGAAIITGSLVHSIAAHGCKVSTDEDTNCIRLRLHTTHNVVPSGAPLGAQCFAVIIMIEDRAFPSPRSQMVFYTSQHSLL